MDTRPHYYPRFAERRVAEDLEVSPVVLLHGPRQCGKNTLAQVMCDLMPLSR